MCGALRQQDRLKTYVEFVWVEVDADVNAIDHLRQIVTHTHTNQLWIGQSIGYTYLLGRITYLHAHSWARRHTNCSLDDVIVGIIVQLWPAAGTSVAKQQLHDPDSTNTNVLDGARRGGLEVTPTVF